MRKSITLLALAIVFGIALLQDGVYRSTTGSLLSSDALVAKHFLLEKDYKILAYEGNPSTYVLSAEKLLQMPFMIEWGLQAANPEPLIGETVRIEKFSVRNPPLDRATGNSEVWVYIADHRVVGGISNPLSKRYLNGTTGIRSLDGKTLEEVQGIDFVTWGARWRHTFENRNLAGMPPFPKATLDGKSIDLARGASCWRTEEHGFCTGDRSPRDTLQYATSVIAAPGAKLSVRFDRPPEEWRLSQWAQEQSAQLVAFEQDGIAVLTTEKGPHIYTLWAKWQEGASNYVFEIDVQ